MNLKLYSYWRSSASWRVRWALELAGLDYQMEFVNLRKGEQKKSDFRKISSSAFVPALLIDNKKLLTQSLAQIVFIQRSSDLELIPEDAFLQSKCMELWEIIAADTHPVQNLSVQMRHSPDPEERKQWAHEFISRGLANYRACSEGITGDFSMGAKLRLCDLALIPQIYNAIRFGVDVEGQFPNLFKIYKNCLATEACRKASPEEQPDAVGSES